jgi:hypothetical protein
MESFESQILEYFASLLFDWSRGWGFTTSISIANYIDSFLFYFILFSVII